MSDFEKTPGEVIVVVAKWGAFLEYLWQDRFRHQPGSFVRPLKCNGFEYECTTPGYTGRCEPRWPLQIGDTVQDGSVIWTCRAYDDQATDAIDSTTWTVPAGLTKGAEATDLLNTKVELSGGTVGENSLLNQIVTRDGRTEQQEITIEVK